MNNISALRHFHHHLVPMNMIRFLILGTVSLMNLSIPILEISGTLIDGLGITFNALVGTIGLVVLYLLRNNIDYSITLTNKKRTVKRAHPAQDSEEEETFEKEIDKEGKTIQK